MPAYVYNAGSDGSGGWTRPADPRIVHVNPLAALGLVEYGGIRIHDGTFVLEALGGLTDTPEVRSTLIDRAEDHGAFISGSFYTARTITIEGYTQTDTLDQLWPAMDQLRGAFGLPGRQILREMSMLMPGWEERRTLQVRPSGPLVVDQLGGSEARKPFRRWQAVLTAPDPRILGVSLYEPQAALGSAMTVENGGNYPAHAVWEVDGPATNPRLEQDGRILQYEGAVATGQTLVIDTQHRTALLNGGNVYRNVTRFDDLTVRHGITTYTATGGTGTWRLLFRDCWV